MVWLDLGFFGLTWVGVLYLMNASDEACSGVNGTEKV